VKHVRNIAIVLGMAAVVYLAPGAGFAAGLLSWLLGVVFLGVLAWFVAVMYRHYRGEVFSLSDGMRALLYACVGLIVLTVTATPRLWASGPGTAVWFALLAVASCGVFVAWRSYQRY
jgi:hypothetical protein